MCSWQEKFVTRRITELRRTLYEQLRRYYFLLPVVTQPPRIAQNSTTIIDTLFINRVSKVKLLLKSTLIDLIISLITFYLTSHKSDPSFEEESFLCVNLTCCPWYRTVFLEGVHINRFVHVWHACISPARFVLRVPIDKDT